MAQLASNWYVVTAAFGESRNLDALPEKNTMRRSAKVEHSDDQQLAYSRQEDSPKFLTLLDSLTFLDGDVTG